MAAQVNWEELLKMKHPSYTVEVNASLANTCISRCTDVSIQKIYSFICDDKNVSENLKMLYHETIYGTNKDVRS